MIFYLNNCTLPEKKQNLWFLIHNIVLLYFGHFESCGMCYSLSHCAFRELSVLEKRSLTLLPPVYAYVPFCPVDKHKTCWKSLKIGHKIHLAHILMPNRLCFISSGVFSFLKIKETKGQSYRSWTGSLLRWFHLSETCKPGSASWLGCYGHLFSAGAANTRYLHDQRNLVSTALWGTKGGSIWA